eukprot:TRINITY_DN3011_c0_g1_i1.p1 TRINITY_DN3011_c0_g1~~TRINITY_DN3011_c0_g1_i1.p1  ORF type:complete len:148 (-),score=27.13 TRINITY_DN3011_c0_g1_i1:32-475(-)
MYVTSYGYDDNSPPSAQIAYPKNAGYPTIHNEATEGTGTYNNPSTFATDPNEIAIGTIIYVTFLKKYYIMEDSCGQCEIDWRSGKRHVDLWIGPDTVSDQNALNNCEDAVTQNSQQVIVNPASDLPVCTIKVFLNNQCSASSCCSIC